MDKFSLEHGLKIKFAEIEHFELKMELLILASGPMIDLKAKEKFDGPTE
tara:strand:- start:129 stop:275 length:147 start_codon:yes stop_codon:yes gene_type:complete